MLNMENEESMWSMRRGLLLVLIVVTAVASGAIGYRALQPSTETAQNTNTVTSEQNENTNSDDLVNNQLPEPTISYLSSYCVAIHDLSPEDVLDQMSTMLPDGLDSGVQSVLENHRKDGNVTRVCKMQAGVLVYFDRADKGYSTPDGYASYITSASPMEVNRIVYWGRRFSDQATEDVLDTDFPINEDVSDCVVGVSAIADQGFLVECSLHDAGNSFETVLDWNIVDNTVTTLRDCASSYDFVTEKSDERCTVDRFTFDPFLGS